MLYSDHICETSTTSVYIQNCTFTLQLVFQNKVSQFIIQVKNIHMNICIILQYGISMDIFKIILFTLYSSQNSSNSWDTAERCSEASAVPPPSPHPLYLWPLVPMQLCNTFDAHQRQFVIFNQLGQNYFLMSCLLLQLPSIVPCLKSDYIQHWCCLELIYNHSLMYCSWRYELSYTYPIFSSNSLTKYSHIYICKIYTLPVLHLHEAHNMENVKIDCMLTQ